MIDVIFDVFVILAKIGIAAAVLGLFCLLIYAAIQGIREDWHGPR